MLERLTIRDLALVERAEVAFGAGLNAVTGETGAGKSLLVQAVSLLVGERADADAVRDGAAAAVVEGEFRLAGEPARRAAELLGKWGVEFDGETVIIRREVQSGGRSRAAVNQSAVTLAALRQVGEVLADLHGQHEHPSRTGEALSSSLLRPEAGWLLLDRLAGLESERRRYAEALAAWREGSADLERLQASLSTFAERADYLRHAAAELDDARLVEGEEEELARDAARLAHADRLRALVGSALEQLSESESAALAAIAGARHALDQAAALDPTLTDLLPPLQEAEIGIGETVRSLVSYAGGLDADPAALEAVEARRDRIARITRKYRRTVPELIAWRAEVERELGTGDDASGTLERARSVVESSQAECLVAGQALTRRRRAAAREWGPKLTRELKPLGFGAARLEFAVALAAAVPDRQGGEGAEFRPYGLDSVTILFTPNPGEPPRPLQKIASGGELSRVMLALKSALEPQDRVDVLVFDEVDVGIGGVVAQAVGERLRRLARHRQIVCVTHLPMIAALAEHQLRVLKQTSGGRTAARVEAVEGEARIAELARMLAGERVTDTTRRQARELLSAPARPASR
jgi:DNA repair protein RecN (Recombination protein N)